MKHETPGSLASHIHREAFTYLEDIPRLLQSKQINAQAAFLQVTKFLLWIAPNLDEHTHPQLRGEDFTTLAESLRLAALEQWNKDAKPFADTPGALVQLRKIIDHARILERSLSGE